MQKEAKEAIEVEVAKKVLVESELRRKTEEKQKETAGSFRSRRREGGPRRKRAAGGGWKTRRRSKETARGVERCIQRRGEEEQKVKEEWNSV